jgi:hypothetical protein
MVENGQEPLFTEIASRGGPLPGSGPGVINPWRGRPAADPGSVAQIKIPLLRVVNLRSLWKGSSWEGWAIGHWRGPAGLGRARPPAVSCPALVLALARLYASQGPRGCPRSPNRPEGSLSLISPNGLHGKTR